MAAVSVPDELDRIIREALTGPPQSSTRLRPVDRRLAELLGLDPEKVRAKVVDDAGVVENRLGEGGIVNRQPELGRDPALERRSARSDRREGGSPDRPGTNIGAAAIFVDVDQGWEIATLIVPEGNAIEARRPGVVPGGLSAPAGMRGDTDSLRALVERCKRELGYPRQHDQDQEAARDEVRHVLTEESLDAAIIRSGHVRSRRIPADRIECLWWRWEPGPDQLLPERRPRDDPAARADDRAPALRRRRRSRPPRGRARQPRVEGQRVRRGARDEVSRDRLPGALAAALRLSRRERQTRCDASARASRRAAGRAREVARAAREGVERRAPRPPRARTTATTRGGRWSSSGGC